VHEALALQEFPDMLLVTTIAQQESESAAPGRRGFTDLKITLPDVVARLRERPLAQVPQDFLDLAPHLLDQDLARVGGVLGGFEFHD
jgi:hypothetical protein